MTAIKKFIIDTNILLSGLLVKNSIPSIAVDRARREGIIIFSDSTFLEFETVLFRKKFDRYFSTDERLLIKDFIVKVGFTLYFLKFQFAGVQKMINFWNWHLIRSNLYYYRR